MLYMSCTYCKLIHFTNWTVEFVRIAKCIEETKMYKKLIKCIKIFEHFTNCSVHIVTLQYVLEKLYIL
jgi:hypothetical protein